MRNSIVSTSVGVLILSMAVSSGCTGIQKSLEAGLPPAPPVPGTIGIRNLDQLTLSMSAVTGVPMANSSGTLTQAKDYNGNAFNDVANGGNLTFSSFNTTIMPWLSADGNAAGITASMLLSTTGMAGLFCSTMLHNEATTPNLLKTVKWSAGSAGLTPAITAAVINVFATQFWRRPATATEAQILAQAITDASKGLGAFNNGGNNNVAAIQDPSSQATQVVLLAPCTAALSSIAFLSI